MLCRHWRGEEAIGVKSLACRQCVLVCTGQGLVLVRLVVFNPFYVCGWVWVFVFFKSSFCKGWWWNRKVRAVSPALHFFPVLAAELSALCCAHWPCRVLHKSLQLQNHFHCWWWMVAPPSSNPLCCTGVQGREIHSHRACRQSSQEKWVMLEHSVAPVVRSALRGGQTTRCGTWFLTVEFCLLKAVC